VPSVAAIVSEPPPAGAASAQLDEVLHALETLAPEEPSQARIAAYQQQLLRVHRQIESLAAREAAPPRILAGLRTVVRYYDAAEVAWEAEEELRERDKRPRHIPTGEATTAPYFVDTDAEATILEFPFLQETVVREPARGSSRSPGYGGPCRHERYSGRRGGRSWDASRSGCARRASLAAAAAATGRGFGRWRFLSLAACWRFARSRSRRRLRRRRISRCRSLAIGRPVHGRAGGGKRHEILVDSHVHGNVTTLA
jgi:hypothetical protein